MGGSTSDHLGRPPVAEYSGREDVAEEYAADLLTNLEAADRQIAILRGMLERAETTVAAQARELGELRHQLASERRGLRETFSREGDS